MMEVRAHSRTGGELASAELGARYPVDAAFPRTEIAVGEHAVGKFAAQLQQARSLRRPRQWRARLDRLPARDEYRCEAVKLDPQRVLAACCRIKQRGDRRGDAELGWAPVLRNVPGSSQTFSLAKSRMNRLSVLYLLPGGVGVHVGYIAISMVLIRH